MMRLSVQTGCMTHHKTVQISRHPQQVVRQHSLRKRKKRNLKLRRFGFCIVNPRHADTHTCIEGLTSWPRHTLLIFGCGPSNDLVSFKKPLVIILFSCNYGCIPIIHLTLLVVGYREFTCVWCLLTFFCLGILCMLDMTVGTCSTKIPPIYKLPGNTRARNFRHTARRIIWCGTVLGH